MVEPTRGHRGRDVQLRSGIATQPQVSGHDGVAVRDMLELDHLDLAGWTLAADIRLILRMRTAVLRAHDA